MHKNFPLWMVENFVHIDHCLVSFAHCYSHLGKIHYSTVSFNCILGRISFIYLQ